MKKVWIELCERNGVVTDGYLHAIGNAYEQLGYSVDYCHDARLTDGSSNDIYVVAEAPSAFNLFVKGCRNVVFWAQGVWPEESYDRNRSKVRLLACNFVEKLALKRATKVFLISEQQRRYYEKKYSISLEGKFFVMACSNEVFHPESFYTSGKYNNLVFLYAGSLARYQCIGEMLHAFSRAQEAFPEASLLFLTAQQDEAKKLVDGWGLRNVTIDYYPQDKLTNAISSVKYGFIIRDNSVVNQIATPTKISTYIANGIIPVYSSSLASFSESSVSIPRLEYRKGKFVEDLIAFEKEHLIAEQVLSDYENYFHNELDYSSKMGQIKNFLDA